MYTVDRYRSLQVGGVKGRGPGIPSPSSAVPKISVVNDRVDVGWQLASNATVERRYPFPLLALSHSHE